jgi:hypothetical protein
MALKRKGIVKKADEIFSKVIRTVGYCENCGKTKDQAQMQCAHIIGRIVFPTRVDLRNAFCLCAGCHRYYTEHPREFSRFITNTWAQEYYEHVFKKSRSGEKNNWEERIEFLKDIYKQIEAGEMTLAEARKYEW